VGSDARVRFAFVEQAQIDDGVSVGPYAHVRPGSHLRDGARIGTFVEVTRSDIGRESDILHLSYIADAKIGDRCSVGTGSVTVNFNGKTRQKTRLGDDVRLGSKTSLVAPVEVENGAQFPHNATLTGKVPKPATPAQSIASKRKAAAARGTKAKRTPAARRTSR
jgi:bifunctional UDP-N-acetylglucosamine pyrophosphorylase/glucosamine-1-phosphate N-acetyltransferase